MDKFHSSQSAHSERVGFTESFGIERRNSSPSPRPRYPGFSAFSADERSAIRMVTLPLTVAEFRDRVSMLAELELPCLVYLCGSPQEPTRRGVIRRIEQGPERLHLSGDDFSIHLHERNIDSIWLVGSRHALRETMSIEIFGIAGGLVMRILGMQDGNAMAVWQDVMANPSLSVAHSPA